MKMSQIYHKLWQVSCGTVVGSQVMDDILDKVLPRLERLGRARVEMRTALSWVPKTSL